MNTSREEWINDRAYALWEQNGREHGHDHEHWQQANQEWEERERATLSGAMADGLTAGIGMPGADVAGAGAGLPLDATRDEGLTPEELQADTNETPAPRLGKSPSAKRQSKTGSVILGQSEESKGKGKSGKRNGALDSKDLRAL